ncbi:Sporulation kinase E [Novipirellula galeiformis]|uniref:histidine kinase n=1 Tax=Novipirellula galeiformis TaxID=2528004 RepID=A0A5C6CBU9_9BACT|nr:ATP-binding protein [Novipirellula galeiformis]TWU21562.1 Sporulation kinase E [Novipirellula galeiformis]
MPQNQLNPTMFGVPDGRGVRRFAAGLAFLSLVALSVTAWIFFDVAREQEIVARIITHLPQSDMAVVEELSGDLQLRSKLSLLLVLNIVGTAIAFALVVRGYVTSEQSLRDAQVLATDIRASLDGGIITTDQEGRMTSLNPRGRELLGLSEDDGEGMTPSQAGSEHALLDAICHEVNQHQTPIRDRDYTILRNGYEHTLRAGCTRLKNQRNEAVGTVIHVRDVTERVLMEQRLRRMERYMGLGSLAAGLQHEIKNPLSALSLHLQLLGEHVSQNSPDVETQELLDVLHTEVTRITHVLDSFRNYASVNELGRSWVDVATLIEKLVRFLHPQVKKQNVIVKVELPPQSLGSIEADSGRLEQVLLNLALNALAAMPDGGTLQFRLSRIQDSLRIDVSDTGNGIPMEIQSQVFDPYFTTRNDGTGMGLALCDKIVRQHAGSIDFRTSPSGTEFSVMLPMEGNG